MMLVAPHLLAVLLLGAWSGASRAEEAVPGTDRSSREMRFARTCHDETEAKPVLSIYKTAHGVKAMTHARVQSVTCERAARQESAGASTRPLVDNQL